jgi:DNA-binding transcriptional MerR regulator
MFEGNYVTSQRKQEDDDMALNTNKDLKLYYSIKEVAEMFGLNESTLRYWETEFPYLRPKTAGASKVRQYSKKDIEQIQLIYNMVKVRGFKLAAAKKMINANRDGADRRAEVLTRLIEVKQDLQALKHELDGLQ